jgi:hypothetical protein
MEKDGDILTGFRSLRMPGIFGVRGMESRDEFTVMHTKGRS